MKGLEVTKNIKEIKFEGVWDELESKNFPETVTQVSQIVSNISIFETNSSFHVK